MNTGPAGPIPQGATAHSGDKDLLCCLLHARLLCDALQDTVIRTVMRHPKFLEAMEDLIQTFSKMEVTVSEGSCVSIVTCHCQVHSLKHISVNDKCTWFACDMFALLVCRRCQALEGSAGGVLQEGGSSI